MKKNHIIDFLLFASIIFVFILSFSPRPALAGTWTQQAGSNSSAGSGTWVTMASSADGSKLAATDGVSIFTSIDSGVTWVNQTYTSLGTKSWNAITSSADGSKLAATVNGGYIYTSIDSGANWIARTGAGSRGWSAITSSADGSKLVATVSNGGIYTSNNGGTTWVAEMTFDPQYWSGITSSADGSKLVATDNATTYSYISTDGGYTWSSTLPVYGKKVASSADGSKLAITGNYSFYTSTNGGASWTTQTNPDTQHASYTVASSADGSRLALAFDGGYIYLSADSGASWTQQTAAGQRHWSSIVSSADGLKLAAADGWNNSYIYTYAEASVPDAPTSVTAVPGDGQATVYFNLPVTDGGSAITSYTITSSPGNFSTTTAITTGIVSGLANGTSYTFTVKATNSLGDSTASASSTAVIPDILSTITTNAPVMLSASAVSISGTLGTVGVGPIYMEFDTMRNGSMTSSGGYQLINPSSGDSINETVNSLQCGSKYSFDFSLTNSIGTSDGGWQDYVTPACAPTGVTAVAGNGQATISFSHFASGGVPLDTLYTITSSPGNFTATTSNNILVIPPIFNTVSTSTQAIVSGLTNGVSYTFTVKATNIAGESSSSASSTPVIPAGLPGVPGNYLAAPGNGQISLSWTAPASNGSPITSYNIYSFPSNALAATSSATSTSQIITGLTNGNTYYYYITAVNSVGESASSTTVNATPATVPHSPDNLSTHAGDRQVTLSWSSLTADGGSAITQYNIYSSPSNALLATTTSSILVINGLTNGNSYSYYVTAVNAIGESASTSVVSVTPATIPTAPRSLAAASGNGQITLSWLAPIDNGGLAIVQYSIYNSPAHTLAATSTSLNKTIIGLTNGNSYSYYVTAINSAGTSISSAVASATPATVPDAPTGVTAIPGDTQATVSFTSSADNGGAAISYYTIISNPGNFTATTSATSTSGVVTGLNNGTPYTFTVKAHNSAGDSLASAASAIITPQSSLSVPSAPTNVIASPGDSQANINFTASASDGGVAIDYYLITSAPGNFTATTSATSTSATISGPINGTSYTFAVKAHNSLGYSLASASSTPITPQASATVPGAPLNLSAVGTSTTISLSWWAPLSDGNSPLTSYQVDYKQNTGSSWTSISALSPTSTTAVVSSLLGGTIYSFRVIAINAVGSSAASNVATSSLNSLIFSNIVDTPTTTSAQISWSTDGLGTTQVEYGLTNSYGNLTTEKDIFSLLNSHTENLNNLVSCTRYYYRVRSKDALGNQDFGVPESTMTAGCLGDSASASTTLNVIDHTSGGNASLTDGQGGTLLSVALPAAFASSSVDLQINHLASAPVLTAAPVSTGKQMATDKVFDVKALTDISNTVSALSQPGSIAISYTSADISGINEDTLGIYYWNATSSSWTALNNCVLDKGNKRVTCSTPHFSVFALLGDTTTTTSGGGGGGGGGGGSSVASQTFTGTFSVLINQGATSTVNNLVTLSFAAQTGTTKMAISNTTDFSSVSSQGYSSTTNWMLSSDLGTKTVYVKFINSSGLSSDVITSSIELISATSSSLVPIVPTDNVDTVKKSVAVKAVPKVKSLGVKSSDLLQLKFGDYSFKDSDKDGLSDKLELLLGTDPNNADSDNDGYSDGFEVVNGYNPLGDGKLTADQIAIIRAHPQWIDTDNDGVPDALEKAIGTNWKKADTDGDGFSDGVELKSGYNPLAKNKKLKPSAALIKRLKGKVLLEVKSGILLKVDSKGVVSLY